MHIHRVKWTAHTFNLDLENRIKQYVNVWDEQQKAFAFQSMNYKKWPCASWNLQHENERMLDEANFKSAGKHSKVLLHQRKRNWIVSSCNNLQLLN